MFSVKVSWSVQEAKENYGKLRGDLLFCPVPGAAEVRVSKALLSLFRGRGMAAGCLSGAPSKEPGLLAAQG